MKEEYYKDFMSNSDIDINRKIHYRKGLTKKKIVVSGNTLFYRNDVYYEINSHHELFCNLFSKLENSFDKYEDLFKKYMKSAFSGDYEQTDAHYIELIQILKDLHPFFNAGDNAKHYIQMHIAAFFWITFENFLKISYSKNNDIDDVLKTFNDKFLLSMAPIVISTKITRPQILNINIYNKVPSKKESSLHDVTCKMISFVKHYTLPRRFSYDNETTHKALDILQIKHEKSSEDFEDYIVKQINFKIRRYDEMTDTDKVAAIDKLVDLLNLSRKKYQSFEEKVTMVDELFQLLHPKATSKNLYNIFSSHIHVFFDHSPSPSKYKSYDELIDSYRFFDDLYRLKNTLAYYVHTFSDFMVDNRKLSSSQITAYFLDCLEIKDLCTALNKLSTVSTPFNMLNLLEMHPYEVDSRFSDGMVHVYERKSKVLEYLGYGDSISKLSDLYVNNPQNKDRILKDIKKRYDTVLRDTPEDFFNSVIYEFDYFEQLIYMELYEMVIDKKFIRQGKSGICTHYYATSDCRRKYCPTCAKKNCSDKVYRDKMVSNPLYVLQMRIYRQKYYAIQKCYSFDATQLSSEKDKLANWHKSATNLRKEYIANKNESDVASFEKSLQDLLTKYDLN